jgi:hypothetical protein
LPALRSPSGKNPPLPNFGSGETAVIVRSPSEIRMAGLAATRLVWITAIAVCALAILSGLLSGTDGPNSSQQFPGFAFADGGNSAPQVPDFASLDPVAALVGGHTQETAPRTQKTEPPPAQADRGRPVSGQAPGDSHSRIGGRHPESQQEAAGGRPPSSTPGHDRPQAPTVGLPKPPKPSQAPAVTVNVPKPPQAPTVTVNVPKPPPPSEPPTGSSAPSVPQLPQVSVNVSAPVQTPIVKIPDVSVQLP